MSVRNLISMYESKGDQANIDCSSIRFDQSTTRAQRSFTSRVISKPKSNASVTHNESLSNDSDIQSLSMSNRIKFYEEKGQREVPLNHARGITWSRSADNIPVNNNKEIPIHVVDSRIEYTQQVVHRKSTYLQQMKGADVVSKIEILQSYKKEPALLDQEQPYSVNSYQSELEKRILSIN
eukprot:TRINITY_DN3967_c0_g1_i1.p1 TRINITY_DN3967_c0_g1~~TRINITY_DN3967_c0_g1_i1.p1  ORF type:complete len:180 (+),score=25.98 TRINITY_DN3967_c0_g1_i1:170-709(+)